MNSLPDAERIEELLQPYLRGDAEVPKLLFAQLVSYLELLLKWNSKTNLTSVREPEEIVRRHFGESLFAARQLESFRGPFGEYGETVLDFGSGAGFPGLPMHLLKPSLRMTLAESQNKKATFLREVVRSLGLETEIWAGRVESMPPGRRFDLVTMRAVDDMDVALQSAAERSSSRLMLLTTDRQGWKLPKAFEVEATVAIVGSENQQIVMLKRTELVA